MVATPAEITIGNTRRNQFTGPNDTDPGKRAAFGAGKVLYLPGNFADVPVYPFGVPYPIGKRAVAFVVRNLNPAVRCVIDRVGAGSPAAPGGNREE